MTDSALHRDRDRAVSFGAVAAQYDRYRPTVPAALLDDLVAVRPARVLDVGCGTGKVAAALAGRGLAVLGLEPDERMAAVARGHDLDVIIAPFEDWAADGRTFDLLTCGDAWHWIDPVAGAAKAATVVAAGGTVARFWTSGVLDEPLLSAFAAVYRRRAPEIAPLWRPDQHTPLFHATRDEAFAAVPAFAAVQVRTYAWERTYTAREWTGFLGTLSDHQRLGPERLAPLLRELTDTIDDTGVPVRQETYALFARRL